MRKPISLIWNDRKYSRKFPAKILRCWPAMRKIGVFFEDRAMRNACDSDSRCGLACDASTRDAKSLAMRVERCEPLRAGFICHESRSLYAIKHKSWFVHHILCECPSISRDFYAMRPLIWWHILGAYFLLMGRSKLFSIRYRGKREVMWASFEVILPCGLFLFCKVISRDLPTIPLKTSIKLTFSRLFLPRKAFLPCKVKFKKKNNPKKILVNGTKGQTPGVDDGNRESYVKHITAFLC